MDIFTLILISIGLAMDAAAVSIAKGMCFKKEDMLHYAFLLAICFGLFQGIMPLIGYFIGSRFSSFIQQYDHWIAFILLGIVGIKMIVEAFEQKDNACELTLPMKSIVILGVATSIDALAVGVSFVFLDINIFIAAAIITIVTFVISFACVFMGKKMGVMSQKYAEIFGGVILIGIGLKILVEHLFFLG